MNILEYNNVSYDYSVGTPFEKRALKKLSISFELGVITGLIGHTGSGKSTIVQLACGLLRPTEGQVLLGGRDIWEDPKKIRDVRFRVGLVFQYPEYQLFEETVYRDIAFGPKNMGLDEAEIDRRVRDAARFVGIDDDILARSPFDLSGGQKRRAAIAGVIAMEPEVLILDEPAAGLDPRGREEILGGIRRYQRERRNTVIIVSHSMEDMARYADRITVVSEGALFRTGTPAEIFSDAASLSSVGLDVPQITHVMLRLAELGVPVRGGIYTVADARDELMRLYSERTKK